MRHRFSAPQADRLDKLIADCTPLSRKRARTLVTRGGARVDGEPARHPAIRVPQGAVVEVRTRTPAATTPALIERYRDAHVVVIDKPCGLPAQAGRGGGANHVYGVLCHQHRYVGLHHRLDTPASGLMLLTLDRGANSAVADAFRDGTIGRRYLVVVLGDPGPEGRWDHPIDGQPAGTRYRRLATAGGMAVLDVRLETGRTHQIRRHAVESGHPVLGDRRHGGAAGRLWPRLALHAWGLRFPHPHTGETVRVDAPIPNDIAELVEKAGYSLVQPRQAPSVGDGAAPAST